MRCWGLMENCGFPQLNGNIVKCEQKVGKMPKNHVYIHANYLTVYHEKSDCSFETWPIKPCSTKYWLILLKSFKLCNLCVTLKCKVAFVIFFNWKLEMSNGNGKKVCSMAAKLKFFLSATGHDFQFCLAIDNLRKNEIS